MISFFDQVDEWINTGFLEDPPLKGARCRWTDIHKISYFEDPVSFQ